MADEHVEAVLGHPSPALTPFVEQYLGYRLTGFPAGLHRGLPSRRPRFIVSIGDPIDVIAQTDPRQTPERYRCVLGGLQASTALIAHGGDQEGVAVDLTPLGFRALFGMPTGALWNTSVELDEVARGVGNELWERLQSAGSWRERFAACNRVLLRLSASAAPDAVAGELRRAWRLLDASAGAVSVSQLAGEVGWSRQHLARRFSEEFGLSPKLAGRVIRFDRARRALESAGEAVTVARVAAECGYFDQAHLSRDFTDLAGCTPTELLAGDLPSVQDGTVPVTAG